jgi:hypothetical protein
MEEWGFPGRLPIPIACRERLGGLLKYYEREAAPVTMTRVGVEVGTITYM